MKYILFFIITFIAVGFSSVNAAENPLKIACDEAAKNSTSLPENCKVTGDKDPISSADDEGILAKTTNLVSLAAGVISIIAIIIGGIQYVLSSGDSAQVNNAKNTILFAVIGLFIVASAQLLLVFVIKRL